MSKTIEQLQKDKQQLKHRINALFDWFHQSWEDEGVYIESVSVDVRSIGYADGKIDSDAAEVGEIKLRIDNA